MQQDEELDHKLHIDHAAFAVLDLSLIHISSGADGKSSTNALGNVHNEVRKDLRDGDAVSYTHLDVYKRQMIDIPADPNYAQDLRAIEEVDGIAMVSNCLLYTSRCV